ncbi:MAG: hypothetical protein NVS2B8_10400 [Vulcanimicrobiaceae bacterium]
MAAMLSWLSCATAASAERTTIDNVDAPIVRVNIRSGDVTIRTWNRSSVTVDGMSLHIARRTAEPVEQLPILIPQARARGRSGPAVLGPESFVAAAIPSGPRSAIVIASSLQTPSGPVVVTVPNNAVFVYASAHGGDLDVRDVRGGTLVGFTAHGRLALQNVGGTVFVQTVSGPLVVRDSSTERMRARSISGNVTFERCHVRQIEASSVDGTVVYDDGIFDPGLARFESTHGDVAIGTRQSAELAARVAGDGRVYTNFQGGARITGRRDDASAVVGNGGPFVVATTQSGNAYLYDGTLRTRAHLPHPWQQPIATLPAALMHRAGGSGDATIRPYVGQRPNDGDGAGQFVLPDPHAEGARPPEIRAMRSSHPPERAPHTVSHHVEPYVRPSHAPHERPERP